MKLFEEISNPRDIRRKLGLNQHDFWSKVGVTQSGGSRYEQCGDHEIILFYFAQINMLNMHQSYKFPYRTRHVSPALIA